MSERDRDEDAERPKLSWSEVDKLRDRPRSRTSADREPRGAAARARSKHATQQYLKQAGDELFARDRTGSRGDQLARAVRDAHGTPGLDDACHAYLQEVGAPGDASLASLFLDASSVDVLVPTLEGVARELGEGRLELTAGIRTQLRILAESSDDDVAYAAEELLGKP